MLPWVGVDDRAGLLIRFGEAFCLAPFAFLDDVVEVLAYYELDFFCLFYLLDGHYFAEGLFPFSFGVNVGVGLNRADDGIGGDFGDAGALDDGFECGAEVPGAGLVEIEGAGVAKEVGAVSEAVFFDDGGGMAPVNEIVFDLVALRMVANGAFAGVDFWVEAIGSKRCVFFFHGFSFSWLAGGLVERRRGSAALGFFGAGARRRGSGLRGHVGRLVLVATHLSCLV